MGTIFISYRRSDAAGYAGRLFDRLRHWFDGENLFYDLDGIDSGDHFPQRIQTALESATAVLVVIGPGWLSEINRRVDQPGVDFVRREVELSLVRSGQGEALLIVPVLMGGADMPDEHQLHADLQATVAALCPINAHQFHGSQEDWDNQFVRLRERIAKAPGIPPPRFRAPAGSEQAFRVIEHSLSLHFQDPNSLLPRLRDSLGTGHTALCGMGGHRQNPVSPQVQPRVPRPVWRRLVVSGRDRRRPATGCPSRLRGGRRAYKSGRATSNHPQTLAGTPTNTLAAGV
ncbi:MAG: toll/interleukin-1 receptor domain-containing protein [Immundisolibacter sp.]|uniref:toll/interleukin-1 receptor domain-containing protein n=1 Tax=Immundisolibacter sp. TaxID=1934948 RepID=UPI003EE1B96F